MKLGGTIGSIVIGYLAIGAIIGLTQLGLSKIFEPPCSGVAQHTLWRHYPSPPTAEERSEGESGIVLVMKFGWSTAQWLPDIYRELIAGEMSFRDYLLGGYRCIKGPRADSKRTFGPFLEQSEELSAALKAMQERGRADQSGRESIVRD